MKIFIAAAALCWVLACSRASPRPQPLPSDPAVAKSVKATLDFIRQEQQAQSADQYAQAHPTFVESNDTTQQSQQVIGKQGPISPKQDWELVPKTPPAPATTTARSPPPHYRGGAGPLPTPPPFSYSRTTESYYNRYPKGGRAYRRRRQAPQDAAQPVQSPSRPSSVGRDFVPDRSEIVIGSNAIRVSKTDGGGARSRGAATRGSGQ